MKYISKILLIICVSLMGQHAAAQPPKRKKETAAKQATAVNVPMSDRAKAQYPTMQTPTEVVWKAMQIVEMKKDLRSRWSSLSPEDKDEYMKIDEELESLLGYLFSKKE